MCRGPSCCAQCHQGYGTGRNGGLLQLHNRCAQIRHEFFGISQHFTVVIAVVFVEDVAEFLYVSAMSDGKKTSSQEKAAILDIDAVRNLSEQQVVSCLQCLTNFITVLTRRLELAVPPPLKRISTHAMHTTRQPPYQRENSGKLVMHVEPQRKRQDTGR